MGGLFCKESAILRWVLLAVGLWRVLRRNMRRLNVAESHAKPALCLPDPNPVSLRSSEEPECNRSYSEGLTKCQRACSEGPSDAIKACRPKKHATPNSKGVVWQRAVEIEKKVVFHRLMSEDIELQSKDFWHLANEYEALSTCLNFPSCEQYQKKMVDDLTFQ